jgi:hypothetical protein
LSLSIILNMIILQPVSLFESSSQKSMIIGSMTLLSMQFSLQYSFSIMQVITMLKQKIRCAHILVRKNAVLQNYLTQHSNPFSATDTKKYYMKKMKAAYVSSLTSFNRKVVLFLATKPLTCAHINSIGLSSQCPCKLAILSVL